MIAEMPAQRETVPMDDPRRWREKGVEAYALGLPADPGEHQALRDLTGHHADIPPDVEAAWREGWDWARLHHPEWRQCAAPACDRELPSYPEPGWRRKTCSSRCRVALSEAQRGVRVRRHQQGVRSKT